MKQLILALCAMGLALGFNFAATAQTNPVEAVSGKLPEPLSTTTPDNTRYLNDPNLVTGCAAQLALFNDKPCDIIFIGSSATAGWLGAGKAIWENDYAPRHALDFGVDGDKTQNVLWRLNNMDIQNLKPKVAVVLIGGYNTENNTHEIADGIKAVLANTQAAFPGVKIILVSILPSELEHDKMMQVNSIIRSYADDSAVYYLNLVPLMPDVTKTTPNGKTETNWKGLGKDRLHPDAAGYQIWAKAMEPLLSKLLAGG